MTDTFIFICGFCISIMVLTGTFLFTFIEFHRMGKEPDRYRRNQNTDETLK